MFFTVNSTQWVSLCQVKAEAFFYFWVTSSHLATEAALVSVDQRKVTSAQSHQET